jgi:GT2 family glycosyltransferase
MAVTEVRFSIVTPVFNPPKNGFRACQSSVMHQTNASWEWCVVDDCSTSDTTREQLEELVGEGDSRIRIAHRDTNGGIVAASNDGLVMARGDWIVLLDHDDELSADALDRLDEVIRNVDDVDFIYTNEELVSETGEVLAQFEKPAWSPSRMRAQMFTGHLTAYRKSIVDEVGGFDPAFNGSQDYDLALRVAERSRRIVHIPTVAYRWVANAQSVVNNASAKEWAYEAGVRAVQAHCDRVGIDAEVMATSTPGVHRLKARRRPNELVSIIIPTRGDVGTAHGVRRSYVTRCVESIVKSSTYLNVEIVCVFDTGMDGATLSELKATAGDRLRLIEFPEPFNFSRKSNLGALQACGSRLVFLNDDTEVISADWIEAMLRPISEGDVGMVGAKLLFEDGLLQHGGQFMNGVADHVLYRTPSDIPGPMSASLVERECEGVTAACAMVRKDVFFSVGGFCEELPNNYNDVDLCLKIRESGMRIVWTPFAELWHFESASRDSKVSNYEMEFMNRRWLKRLQNDPYFTPMITHPHREWSAPRFR